ncbi:DUF2577 domain-containing protein [Longicatena caecimuris]|uniref:DUF2577 domain-containing protein n=1 Tax=Longicatena caecimuris TaxID=1796635 RepID=UPI0018AA7FDA|nr:DUF2577 domain-containing protein [Longicatena caecimuris]
MANSNLTELIKKAAVEAVNASNPAAFYFGTVTSTSPLNINIEQKMDLSEEFLILTSSVKDYEVDMTFNFNTEQTMLDANHTHESESSGELEIESKLEPEQEGTKIVNEIKSMPSSSIKEAMIDLSHNHSIQGRTTVTVHSGLKTGEKVILIRMQGGQKFVVLDRM